MHSSLRTQRVDSVEVRWVPLRSPTLPPATHTNCVLLGKGRYLLVDPASPWKEEQETLLEVVAALSLAGERLMGILLTHHHVDHVSGANALRQACNVSIYAHARTQQKLAGEIEIDHLLQDEDRLAPVPGWRVVWTPGHAPGHLCAVSDDGVIAAGDMIAGIGTIVIEPEDDGDMTAYLESLARLRALRPRCLVPAHGEPILDADQRLAGYIEHRLRREAQVRASLGAEQRTVMALVPAVYPEVSPRIHPLAARSLLAHLQKLEKEGAAQVDSLGRWSAK